jgi:hypothetical protein
MGKVGLGSSFNSFSVLLDERILAYRDDALMAPKWQFDDTTIAVLPRRYAPRDGGRTVMI